jgi:hypothetical protein
MSCIKLNPRVPIRNEDDCQEIPTIPDKKGVSSKPSNKALNENSGPMKILTPSYILKFNASGI